MKHTFRSACTAAAVAAALALSALLAACGGTAGTAPSSQVLDNAPASQTVPSGEGDTTSSPAVNGEENSPLSDPADAFALGLGWGPGTAGTSLKSVAAAAALLDWADENSLSGRSADSLDECLTGWYDGLDSFDRETFAEAWPLIRDAAQRILDDPDAVAAELDDAGVENSPLCDEADWDALSAALDAVVPAPLQ